MSFWFVVKFFLQNTKVIIIPPIQSLSVCHISLSRFLSVSLSVCVCAFPYVSQFGAEFRRFSLDRSKPGRFDEFYGLLQHVHRIPNVDLLVGYADVHGDLLPINNDDNYQKAMSVANPLLRLFLQRKEPQEDETERCREGNRGVLSQAATPAKSLFRRMSDRVARIGKGLTNPRACSSPLSSPSSPLALEAACTGMAHQTASSDSRERQGRENQASLDERGQRVKERLQEAGRD
ncbi:unnamed protein product [Coregonus sp. 'balchen']|nr:unnamed protein product [Coregonus sp. 'balchen']